MSITGKQITINDFIPLADPKAQIQARKKEATRRVRAARYMVWDRDPIPLWPAAAGYNDTIPTRISNQVY